MNFLFILFGLFFSGFSLAAGPDLSPLTAAVDFGTVTVAVLSIAGMLAVLYLAKLGSEMVLAILWQRQADRDFEMEEGYRDRGHD